MNEDTYRCIDAWIKIIGLVALFASGWFAWHQYQGLREREFKEAFYAQQIATINSVFQTLTAIDNAKSKEEQDAEVKRFWMIYQGSGRTFLDPAMFQALKAPADYVNGCITKIRKPAFDCSNFTASMSAAGFARVARQELSLGWNMSFKQIGAEDPWVEPRR